MRVIRLLAPVLPLLAIIACGGSDGSSSPTPPTSTNKAWDVFTTGLAFSPNTLQISAGDTVRFNFSQTSAGEGHDVTFAAKSGAPQSIPVTKTGTVQRVFNTKGTFHYDCF